MNDDNEVVTAHHEAGHAIATLMRGGGRVRSVSIEPSAKHLGITRISIKPWDDAFVTFAGVWAEAHYLWLKDERSYTEDGIQFGDVLTTVFISQKDDCNDYYRALKDDPASMLLDPEVCEPCWGTELQQVWIAIERLAKRLLAERTVYEVSPEWISA